MPKNEEGEFELILGNKQLLSVFFIVVVLLGVFFTMGYIVGRNPLTTADAIPGEKAIGRNQSRWWWIRLLRTNRRAGEGNSGPRSAGAHSRETAPQQPAEQAASKPEPPARKPEPVKQKAEPVRAAMVDRPQRNVSSTGGDFAARSGYRSGCAAEQRISCNVGGDPRKARHFPRAGGSGAGYQHQ